MLRTRDTRVVRTQTIYTLINGKMTRTGDPRMPDRANFVIMCTFGDWSGFRTLAECESQFAELEARRMEDYYFWVEER